ncbi:DUF418 domain-containing protein [Micromonospora sonneratiae]|uniref:DUF418 domain-containing protein n=1 Tax=Micromonospora sonneratiae TaxID=1184706 RepID=A0ABW3YAQ5_9ACTN
MAAVEVAVGRGGGGTGQHHGRLALLDVLRGVAILGTLATNIWIFATPGGEQRVLDDSASISVTAGLSTDPGAALVEGAFRFLANGKFLALLTILFGVGLAIQHRSSQSRGRPWLRSYLWRPVLLFIEGSLHFLLIFAYDVLMGYALTAVLVAVLVGRSVRTQRVAMYLAGSLHVTFMALLTVALLLAPATGPATTTDGAPRGEGALFTTGSYLDQVSFRVENLLALRLEPIISFGLLVFLFLLGVRLFHAGAFGADERGQLLRRRLIWIGLGVGLPLNVSTTLIGPELFLVDRYVCAPIMALGYLGLVGWIVDRARSADPVTTALAAVGRTALSGYVLQNLLSAIVCYGWGLGLATALDASRPWWVLAMWVMVGVILVGMSRLWLRWLGQGPLEAAQKWVLTRLSR